jgi:hypothetical protein
MIGPANNKTQLDLVPETPNPPYDEHGTSFVTALCGGRP